MWAFLWLMYKKCMQCNHASSIKQTYNQSPQCKSSAVHLWAFDSWNKCLCNNSETNASNIHASTQRSDASAFKAALVILTDNGQVSFLIKYFNMQIQLKKHISLSREASVWPPEECHCSLFQMKHDCKHRRVCLREVPMCKLLTSFTSEMRSRQSHLLRSSQHTQ